MALPKEALLEDAASATNYINTILPMIGRVSWPILIEHKAGRLLKQLTYHPYRYPQYLDSKNKLSWFIEICVFVFVGRGVI